MRERHFSAFRPICPVCRFNNPSDGFPLRIAHVERQEADHILEGVLHCTNERCLREFPIIDGIPLIIANIRQYVGDNILAIYGRKDLSDFVEGILGDCCGPGSAYDLMRQHVSSYVWDHYGDLDPNEAKGNPSPGSMLENLGVGLKSAGFPSIKMELECLQKELPERGNDGRARVETPSLKPMVFKEPIIDLGCSAGRSSFALAEINEALVLGVDLHFSLLRVAVEALRHGRVTYPRRHTGLVYERRCFPVQFMNNENVDFWLCDATALPFPSETFGFATSMNVLDCVKSPRDLLESVSQVLKKGGKGLLTCPYDWSPAATPLEAWLGGHSQRSPLVGSGEAVLRSLLTPGFHPNSLKTLKLIAEKDDLEWRVRLHDRSTMTYKVHLVVAEKLL